jgi:hypothetical protein
MTTASFATAAAQPSLHGKAIQKKHLRVLFFAASDFDLLTQILYEFILASRYAKPRSPSQYGPTMAF